MLWSGEKFFNNNFLLKPCFLGSVNLQKILSLLNIGTGIYKCIIIYFWKHLCSGSIFENLFNKNLKGKNTKND